MLSLVARVTLNGRERLKQLSVAVGVVGLGMNTDTELSLLWRVPTLVATWRWLLLPSWPIWVTWFIS